MTFWEYQAAVARRKSALFVTQARRGGADSLDLRGGHFGGDAGELAADVSDDGGDFGVGKVGLGGHDAAEGLAIDEAFAGLAVEDNADDGGWVGV